MWTRKLLAFPRWFRADWDSCWCPPSTHSRVHCSQGRARLRCVTPVINRKSLFTTVFSPPMIDRVWGNTLTPWSKHTVPYCTVVSYAKKLGEDRRGLDSVRVPSSRLSFRETSISSELRVDAYRCSRASRKDVHVPPLDRAELFLVNLGHP